MRSLQDYRDIYKEIASSNNITGDSVELLVQLLANASYISEVENISYVQEASLERCTLINSKIHHCMDQMYSVFRGRCPRVMIKFKPTKYMEFNVYDPIVNSNDFTVYYLGYLNTEETDEDIVDNYTDDTSHRSELGTRNLPIEDGFVYGPCTIMPAVSDDDTYTIIGLIAKEKIEMNWDTTSNNQYYVETIEENLSNDLWVKAGANNSSMDFFEVSRVFSDHILNRCIFDLTTTSYSSRLYFSGIFDDSELNRNDEPVPGEGPNGNITIQATYYKFSRISEYKPAELKKINISGAEMKAFDRQFLDSRTEGSQIADGVFIISEVDRDSVGVIHYKANRDRFVNSIIRSNSDLGTVLEEMYPYKVMPYGTNFEFHSGDGSSYVNIYYVPKDITNLLTDDEISDFVETKKAYYIVDDTIYVDPGQMITAHFNIDIELYNSLTIDSEITDILKNYENKFNVDLEGSLDEIKTLISKVSNVKRVIGLSVTYLLGNDGNSNSIRYPVNDEIYDDRYGVYTTSGDEIEVIHTVNPNIYFKVEYNINSIIQTRL